MTSPAEYTVLVTGGAGCLGQHLIRLLQTHAPSVKEIRMLDVKPYENRLDYECTKPVRQLIGSINDREIVTRACQGVSAVFHLASIVDYSMFPNANRMELVNFEGTSMLLEVCKETGVKRFIYCSSMSVVLGKYNINGGTESNTSFPEVPLHNGYATTKQRAETLVIESNSNTLKTTSIRPVTFYGEEDIVFVSNVLEITKKYGGRWQMFDCKGAVHQMAYAGNIAWEFVCAEKAMLKDENNKIGGNIFFAADDTPMADAYEMMTPFAAGCNFSINRFKLPMWLILYPVYVLYIVLWIISFFVRVNIPFSVASFEQLLFSYNFKYDKAKNMLGYTPLYSYEDSLKRSMTFYKRYTKV